MQISWNTMAHTALLIDTLYTLKCMNILFEQINIKPQISHGLTRSKQI